MPSSWGLSGKWSATQGHTSKEREYISGIGHKGRMGGGHGGPSFQASMCNSSCLHVKTCATTLPFYLGRQRKVCSSHLQTRWKHMSEPIVTLSKCFGMGRSVRDETLIVYRLWGQGAMAWVLLQLLYWKSNFQTDILAVFGGGDLGWLISCFSHCRGNIPKRSNWRKYNGWFCQRTQCTVTEKGISVWGVLMRLATSVGRLPSFH